MLIEAFSARLQSRWNSVAESLVTAMVRMRSDPRTRAYVERRTKEGLSNKEIHRCLKRYIVRELYPLIMADLTESSLGP